MGKPDPYGQILALCRFVRYVLPHWKLVLVAMLATFMYAMAAGAGVVVLKPVLEGMGLARAREVDAPPQPEERIAGGAREKGLVQALDDMRDRLERRLLRVGPIRKLTEYLGPGPDRFKHIAYLILFFVAPMWGVTVFAQTYATGRITWLVMADIRIALFEKLSRMSLSFFTFQRTGDLVSRVTNDVSTTRTVTRMVFSDILIQPLRACGFFLGALYISPKLTLFALIVAPVLAALMIRFGKRIVKHGRKVRARLGDITDALNQMFAGIRVVKAFGMEEEESAEFRETNRQQLKRVTRMVRERAWSASITQSFLAAVAALLLLLGSRYVAAGTVKLTELLVVVAALWFVVGPIRRIVKCYNVVQVSRGALERIFELIDQPVDFDDAPGAVALEGVEEGVRFRNVWFAYRDDQHVLQDIDLHVPAGKVCAVVGATGAGKSTMLDLIPRFYDPARGAVEIDGVDLRGITHESLLKQIAIVGQHPFLFNRSVADNVRYGRRDATDREVAEAIEAANLRQFIESRPEGANMPVGERGEKLSGGQRQCVAIARALLKDAPILILDEATSSLDNESERLVQRALSKLLKGRTAFVIAHRLSTVRFADMIVVLKAGRIVEQGTHDELLALGGEYAKFHALQFIDPSLGPEEVTAGVAGPETTGPDLEVASGTGRIAESEEL